jgi:hypothetical protein
MLITVPKALRERLGEEASEGLIELLNSQSQNSNNSITTFVEEKFERRLSEEMAKFRSELSDGISKVREESQKNQTATIRWMFLFWVGQIGAMLGILFAFFD